MKTSYKEPELEVIFCDFHDITTIRGLAGNAPIHDNNDGIGDSTF